MSYLGNPPTSAAFVTDTFNGTGSQTAYTMSVAPASTASMLVIVGAVLQDPSSYSIVGMTLNFSSAPPSGTGNISVRYMGIPAAGVVNTAYRTVTDITATAGQTTITVPSYTVGFIDVFRNGARLGATDFTATNGTSITLALAANANDLITTVSFSVSSVLNAIPATPNSVLPYIGNRALSANQMPAGSVLQVVQAVTSTAQSISTSSFVDLSGLQVTVTPSSNTSKFLLSYSAQVLLYTTGRGVGIRFLRDSTPLFTPGNLFELYSGNGGDVRYRANNEFLDSPATTNPVTYKLQAASYQSGLCEFQNGSLYQSTLTVMEIAA